VGVTFTPNTLGLGTFSHDAAEQFLSKPLVRSFPFPTFVCGLSPRQQGNRFFRRLSIMSSAYQAMC
jgi:hypothetical protein